MRFTKLCLSLALCLGTVSLPALAAGPLAYEATGNDLFGSLDLGTGVFSVIGPMGALLSGLGVSAGAIYGGVDATINLDSVNTGSGSLTLVGGGSFGYLDTGSTLTGLYGIDPNMRLFSINPTTGASSLVGSLGVGINGTIGLSTNSGTLYFTDAGILYTINTGTGAATPVGSLVTTNAVGALVFINGTLYAGDTANHSVDTINTTTGAATLGPLETGPATSFWGLAPQLNAAGIPEPGTLVLLGGSIAAFALLRRRTRYPSAERR